MLSEEEQCTVLAIIADLPCAAVSTSSTCIGQEGDPAGKIACVLCDSDVNLKSSWSNKAWGIGQHSDDCATVLSFMERLVELPQLQRSKKPRILAALATRRIMNHLTAGSSLDLATSPLGQWCLRSLHSSLRELRITAGYVYSPFASTTFTNLTVISSHALTAFLRRDVPVDKRRNNRMLTLNFLKTLSDRNELGVQESLVLAWGQVAR